jgi:glycosyltransferase involved in cell wall biosynthesis
MRLLIAFDARLDRTPDGRVWWDGSADYSFWQRYLEVFEEVRVVARLRDVDQVFGHARQIDGPQVSVAPVPYFIGPWQFARRFLAVRRAIRATLRPTDAVLLRVPGTIGTCLASVLQARGHPYAVEVIADPYDVFAPGGVRSALRPLMRWWYPRHLRRQCAGACAAAYVTADTLQRRYPAQPRAFVTSYSSLELDNSAFVPEPRPIRPDQQQFKLVFIGSLEQLYKGPDVLIEAVAHNVHRGLDLGLTIIGDGRHRPELEALAAAGRVADRVRFVGRLPAGEPVRRELDQSDLFVLPSRTEGLPRALIEAQARGLPCLGTQVGGIPELLPPEDLVAPGDVQALAAKIGEVLADPQRRACMAARNLAKARQHHADVLRARRRAMYQALRDATASWQSR